LLRIPLALLIPGWTGWGLNSIAIIISVTCALRATLIVAWAARGTWKRGLSRELRTAGTESGSSAEFSNRA